MIKKESRNSMRLVRHERIRKQIMGTSACPRLCVFRSNAEIYCQVIDDVAGVTLASASSKAMKLTNGGNIEGAKLVGAEIAKVCLAKGIETIVFDRGGNVYHGRVKALAEAARENGLKF